MKTEYELRVLEIDKDVLIKKLEEMGAIKKGEYEQKRFVYDLKPAQKGKWIRLRTNGLKTTLTYKNIINDNIDGTKEIEVIVSDFDLTNEFLEKIGFKNRNYQENRRTQYVLNDIEIDIDTWPMIPTYIEIEGNSEQDVLSFINKLEINNNQNIVSYGVKKIYEHYGINLEDIKTLKF